MKLVQTEKTFKTNADFVSQDFTIGDVSVVIEILRNKMYRHKVRTLVQEYISNARDAMREVNSNKKVQVTVPTMFSPTFKVRDFGLGISPDRMYNVFIKYASSTKRDSNKQTGGFGIGAKSAWSYTESFTIVTFIDGIQRSYVAHIGANNNGRLDFLGEQPTTEANGTEIQVPVSPKDITDFKNAALRAVYFWNEDERPTLNGLSYDELHDRIEGDMIGNLEVNNNIPDYVVSKWDNGIIMSIDGIPYVAGQSLIDKIPRLASLTETVVGRLVLHIANGELEVSASREEISDSKHTLDNLDNIAKDALKTITAKITKEFSKVKNPFDHLSIYMELKDKYNLDAYRKCGDFLVNDKNSIESELFHQVKIETCTMMQQQMKLYKDNLSRYSNRRYSRRGAIKSDLFDSLFFIDGTEKMIETNYRIKSYLEDNNAIVVFTKQPTDSGEFDKLKKGLGLKDLKTISYVKPNRQNRVSTKIERTKKQFCLHRLDRWLNGTINTSLDSNTQSWLYVERTNNMDKHSLQKLNSYVESQGYKLCALSKDSIRRVKGDKNFKELSSFLKTYKASKADINNLKHEAAKNRDVIVELSKLTGITDKFLVKMIAEYKTQKDSVSIVPDMLKKVLGKVSEVETFKVDDKALTDVINDKYSLLNYIDWNTSKKCLDEVVVYINSK